MTDWARDAFMAVPWAACNALLLRGAWRWARCWHPDATPAHIAVDVILLAWATVTAAGLALGACGVLTGPNLLALVGGVSLIANLPKFAPKPRTASEPAATDGWGWVWAVVA